MDEKIMQKEYKKYNCICGMDFGNRKDNYISHLNKKKPCANTLHQNAPNTEKIHQNTPNTEKIHQNISNTEKIHQDIQVCIEIKQPKDNIHNEDIDIDKDKKTDIINYPCEFCNKIFTRKFSLERHLDNRCKKKPNQNLENSEFKQNAKLEIFEDKLNMVLKENEQLKMKIEKLETKIKRTKKTTTNININQQNININQNIMVNFSDLDYEEMDKKLFTHPIMNPRLQGKYIILQMIENVYINETHPEYQNLIITDKNRGYVKIYNNGKWKTDNINTINMIIDGIISHSKTILVELKQQYLNNSNAKNRLNTSEKYISLCDLEHLNDLEDEELNDDVNNKERIKRCKDFREMVYKDTINLFHDNKNLLLKQKNNSQQIIDLD
jgi:hypothetical protein